MIGERKPASRLVKPRSYLVDARPTNKFVSSSLFEFKIARF